MLCEEICGTLSEDRFAGLRIDPVRIEWHEAFARLHRVRSAEGEDVGIRLEPGILRRGLRQGDVLYADEEKVIAVEIPPCEAIRASVRTDHPGQIAKLCYEVGNTHTTMFRGEDAFTFYMPYSKPLCEKVAGIHGVTVEKVCMRFDFDRALSSSINDHHH